MIPRLGLGVEIGDFEATKLGRKEVVQVKHYSLDNKVGSQEVREYATLYQQVPDANTVVIVTSSSFTQQAEELAEDLKVELFDRQSLSEEIENHDISTKIDVSRPPSETPSDFTTKGLVDFFNNTGGYGFIATEGVDQDVFFHVEDLRFESLEEGQKVGLDIEETSKGPRAKNVVRLDSSTSVNTESNRKDSGCFIATAAYGTPTANEIDVLRAFRDKSLRGTLIGEVFISAYYSASPPVADYIEKSDHRQQVVRKLLIEPLINMVRIFH
jgi:cold shock CspA family protein